MLVRKVTSQRHEPDWFQFSAGLMHSLCSDYIALRLLYSVEPLTTAMTVCTKMLDVVEKALKLHLAVQTQTPTALADARSEYGHNLERLRVACSQYQPTFDEPDVRAFTKDLNDRDGKLYQHMRYGSQETTSGFETNLAVLLPVVDKIFAKSLLLLPEGPRKVLLFSCTLKNLVTRSRFDQSQYPVQLIAMLEHNNVLFAELVTLFRTLDEEQEALVAQLRAAKEGSPGA
jgi:hypothetical protein